MQTHTHTKQERKRESDTDTNTQQKGILETDANTHIKKRQKESERGVEKVRERG